jgi:protein SCO1
MMHPLTPAAAVLAISLAGALPALAHDGHGKAPPPEELVVTHNPDALGQGYARPDVAQLGGPFMMTDHNGRTVTQASWPGQWLLITFGFPGCRESCPVALDHISKALETMGPDARAIQPLFVDVSLDKTPDIKGMKQFVSNFHDRLVGLTGTRMQSFSMLRHFLVRREYVHMTSSRKETGPRINHTTYIYVVDPANRVRGYFYHDLPPERMEEAIRGFMKTASVSP